ncbi:MAG: ABC transporter permease [Ignavibacteriaceae bacterium]|nr:ABC transporter permease [Ignavibacteriaceae bacterium]
MVFPFYISKRFTFSRKDSKFFSFISVISIIGIALGVATLIIALSILKGFEKTITNKIIDFDSHIKLTSLIKTLPDYHTQLPRIESLLGNNLLEINPYASSLAIITSKRGTEGINIIGVMPQDRMRGIKENITSGKIMIDKGESILIGKKLADKIYAKTGDKVTLFTLNNDKIPSAENMPNVKNFVISGIFESGMAEYDDAYAYISLKDAQSLLKMGDNVNGYDIRVKDITKIDSLTDLLREKLRYPYRSASIYELHKNIFTWIDLQKKPIPIVLGLIIIVAVFNIIGTLLMMVLEKTSAIGILKSLGASRSQVTGIFLFQGIVLAIAGIILGNVIGYLIMEIQLRYNIITLPSSVYFMSTVPIYLSATIFGGVSLLTLLLCIMASIIPSYIASRIKAVSTIRFN